MKPPLRSLVLACLPLVLAVACASPGSGGAGQEVQLDCICGTPEAAIEACPHPTCAAGERNPANPDCVCGGLDLER